MYFTNCTALDIIICTLPIHSTRYYCLYYYQVSLIFTWESVSPLVTCRSVDSSLQLCSLHCYCLSLQPRPACLGSLLLSGGQVWPAPTSLSGVLSNNSSGCLPADSWPCNRSGTAPLRRLSSCCLVHFRYPVIRYLPF